MCLPCLRRFNIRQTPGGRSVPLRNPGWNDPSPKCHTPPGPGLANERNEAGDASRVPAIGHRDVRGLHQLHREGGGVEGHRQRQRQLIPKKSRISKWCFYKQR